jgi:ubiquinol-cytochrome c reductase cytochrome b subunit
VRKFFDWLDHRTGYRKLRDVMLLEHIPGGAKWRYVWGSALAFVFLIQLITGILLMFHYSPGDSTAWGSVYFIQYEMDFGWLIRGLHHFGSQTMVVLLGVHMLQVVIAGAHLPPREVNWWLGLALMGIVLGMSLTGYLLPWDQKGFWATQVATNIASKMPLIGPFLQKTLVGGAEYGHHTLTHFYALHVAVLPLLLIGLLIAHIAVFRRHGVTAPRNAQGEGVFWPDQAFRDMLVSMLVFAVMLGLVIYGHGNPIARPADAEEAGWYDKIAHAGHWGRGAHLDAPADLQTEEYEARPEWYFLFLFQLLKYFQGDLVIIGTVLIPVGVMVLLFLLPLLGYGRMRTFGHVFGVLVVVALLAGVGVLTYQAIDADKNDPEFQKKMVAQEALARRVVQVGGQIPEEGAKYLLRRDPLTAGPKLFERHCMVCHLPAAELKVEGERLLDKKGKPVERDKAPDLTNFGTKDWIHRFLKNPDHEDFLARTPFLTKRKRDKVALSAMQRWIDDNFPNVARNADELKNLPAEDKELLKEDRQDLEMIAEWLARHPRKTADTDKDEEFQKGLELFEKRGCVSCHKYEGKGATTGPDLTGYADAEWIRGMIMAPYHPARYGLRNRMFVFREFADANKERVLKEEFARFIDLVSKTEEVPKEDVEKAYKLVHLSDVDREVIIRYLSRDVRVVFLGDLAPPKR